MTKKESIQTKVPKERIDKLLVQIGLAESREKAQAFLLSGIVLVQDQPVTKAGTKVSVDAKIRLKGEQLAFVGRGGLKVEHALEHFNINPLHKLCLDVGASTGGFTDCLLQAGASFVWAVDVGTNQLHFRLRQHKQVMSLEGVNFRHVDLGLTGSFVDIIVIDVSFISLKLILPKACEFLTRGGSIIALVKPQFEVGPDKLQRGGTVAKEKDRLAAIEEIKRFSHEIGLVVAGEVDSPIEGKKSGNLEYLLQLVKQ
ncbi:MAG: TlyA family RNA methyltransferase [SAR324 cluster bacterium]|nr:TlyA family RNA methyltransferase [SAR324 cluster bacterium]